MRDVRCVCKGAKSGESWQLIVNFIVSVLNIVLSVTGSDCKYCEMIRGVLTGMKSVEAGQYVSAPWAANGGKQTTAIVTDAPAGAATCTVTFLGTVASETVQVCADWLHSLSLLHTVLDQCRLSCWDRQICLSGTWNVNRMMWLAKSWFM